VPVRSHALGASIAGNFYHLKDKDAGQERLAIACLALLQPVAAAQDAKSCSFDHRVCLLQTWACGWACMAWAAAVAAPPTCGQLAATLGGPPWPAQLGAHLPASDAI
jgi:hypothetical protein